MKTYICRECDDDADDFADDCGGACTLTVDETVNVPVWCPFPGPIAVAYKASWEEVPK